MLKILLVEDEPELGEALSEILANEAYTVEVASDGKGALERPSSLNLTA